jgi:hypothetical protein
MNSIPSESCYFVFHSHNLIGYTWVTIPHPSPRSHANIVVLFLSVTFAASVYLIHLFRFVFVFTTINSHGLANLAHVKNGSGVSSSGDGTASSAKRSPVKHSDDLLTADSKDLESLLDTGETFESVNEKISSELLEQILSQDGDASSALKLGSSARKLEERMEKKIHSISAVLRQVSLPGKKCVSCLMLVSMSAIRDTMYRQKASFSWSEKQPQ